MKIAVDARTIYARNRRGTGKNLIDAYHALAAARPTWQFVMIHRGQHDDAPFAGVDNVSDHVIDTRGDRWNVWEQIALPWAARRLRANALHCPANSCPWWSAVPVVSTIHDLIPLKISDPAEDGWRRTFARRVRRCARRSRRIIAVSHSTKRDIISDLGADPARIDVITWAADSSCQTPVDEAALAPIKARYNIRDRYFVALTGASRRKNAAGVLSAYARLPQDIRSIVQLVLVGIEPEASRQRLGAMVEEYGLRDRCVIRGFVPESDVPALIAGADALLFCSRYEGFGLPILDAFRCGTAVVCSNVASIPEVAGDAALYCDPDNLQDMARVMTQVVADDQRRADLVRRGARREKMFSWQRTADQLAGVFEKSMNRSPGAERVETVVEPQVS